MGTHPLAVIRAGISPFPPHNGVYFRRRICSQSDGGAGLDTCLVVALRRLAQVGTAVAFVSFALPGLHQSIPDAAEAQVTLSEITQHLSVYASGS